MAGDQHLYFLVMKFCKNKSFLVRWGFYGALGLWIFLTAPMIRPNDNSFPNSRTTPVRNSSLFELTEFIHFGLLKPNHSSPGSKSIYFPTFL